MHPMRQFIDISEKIVWHGSPHGGFDSFSTDHIGSGEGTLAFGWGLYFASKKVVARRYGKLYRVTLPNNGYLIWDEPLDAQSAAVTSAIAPYIDEYGPQHDPKTWDVHYGTPQTGGQAYDTMARKLGSQKAASHALLDSGVIGIKYLDGQSRSRGRGTYNYVIFDARVVTWTAKQNAISA